MADEKRTLEMRVAELEDKLAQVHITEDEMATYNKVAAKLGAAQPCQSCQSFQPTPSPCIAQPIQSCVAQQCAIQHCIIQQCIIRCIIKPIYWNDCIGPCAPGNCATGGLGGGGFGGLGG